MPTLNTEGPSIELTIALASFSRGESFASLVVACDDPNVSGLAWPSTTLALLLAGEVPNCRRFGALIKSDSRDDCVAYQCS